MPCASSGCVPPMQVAISNPDKLYFPRAGVTKLDLVRYYLAVAEGALRGVRGRPMALKRFVNGAEGEAFFQKRAPESRPDWIETVELRFPSGRSASEIVVRDDTDSAMAHAHQLRARYEFPPLAGSITIPYITTYYEVGDRIEQVAGRGVSLTTNIGQDPGEVHYKPGRGGAVDHPVVVGEL